MIKNLIFDLDGTIAEDMNEFFDIFNKLSNKYGYQKIEKNQVEKFKDEGAQWLLKNIKISTWKIPFLISESRNMLNKTIENINPFKGMPEVLKNLGNSGITLGILTTNTDTNVKKFLDKNNLDVFDFVYSKSSLFGKNKIITNILKRRHLEKEETCYIGDEDRDIEAAKKAGVKSAAVTWGFNTKKRLASINPDFLITKPSDILTIVK
jgi:HAD superfamily hydrolase (TIGR01549 family)